MVNAPHISLKVVLLVHIILTTFAAMASQFLPPAYLYLHGFIFAFAIWALINQESTEGILMFLILTLCSIIIDIIFLSVFTVPARKAYERLQSGDVDLMGTYRFSLGMAIVNLLIKPFSCFVMYRIYQDRGGHYSDLGIPGIPGFDHGGNMHAGSPAGHRGYENIDQSVPSSMDPNLPSHGYDGKTSPVLTP